MAEFEIRTELNCSPETAFEFLARPQNIRLITPSAMMLVFDEAPETLTLGSRMTFRVQAFGVVRSATHEVTTFDPPSRFVERQVAGPMGDWEHEHLFEPTTNGVAVIDRITFTPPGGMLGLVVNERRILESLEVGFGHRHYELEKRFGKPSPSRSVSTTHLPK